MNNMKSIYRKLAAIILLFYFFAPGIVLGQNNNVKDHISIKKNYINIDKSGNVLINIDILLNGVEVSSNRQLVLTPIIREGDNRIELPPVVVNGKKRANLYKRSLALGGKSDNTYSVIKASKKKVFTDISYKTSIPYESWMKKASVYMIEDLCGCGGAGEEYVSALIANEIDYLEFKGNFTPYVNFITPQKEDVKKRYEHGWAYIIFEPEKWNILPELYKNSRELEKIKNSLQYVIDEPTTQITSVSIKAYASPEASAEYNLTLSEKRAVALSDYIKRFYNIPAGIFTAKGIGEDWEELERIVSSDSQIEHKSEILRIIRSNSSFDDKEKQLRGIAGGAPWNYLLTNYFPRLRRSDYKIEYNVPHYSVEKGKELLKSKPNMLSLEEMYKIAYSYEESSKQFIDAFLQAANSFPNDKIANMNGAAANILEGNFKEAQKTLEQYESDPNAWNNLGIVYMYRNDFQQAQYYLEKAKAQGITNAVKNLQSLEKVKEQYKAYLQDKAEFDK
jgi:tetratricopeptide (TPR) repeat protein